MLVVAHRGASHRARENTLEAFALAHELGADGVELDVHRSSDHELVVHHDPEVEGFGLIAERPFGELRAHDAEIPTLAEVLAVVAPMRFVNIEMKGCGWDPDADTGRVVARGVARLVDELVLRDRVVVSSFDIEMLDDLRALDARLTTGFLTSGKPAVPGVARAREHGHAWFHPDWGHLMADLDATIAAAREQGEHVATWTVDAPDAIATFARAGVDALITNEPDVAVAAIS